MTNTDVISRKAKPRCLASKTVESLSLMLEGPDKVHGSDSRAAFGHTQREFFGGRRHSTRPSVVRFFGGVDIVGFLRNGTPPKKPDD